MQIQFSFNGMVLFWVVVQKCHAVHSACCSCDFLAVHAIGWFLSTQVLDLAASGTTCLMHVWFAVSSPVFFQYLTRLRQDRRSIQNWTAKPLTFWWSLDFNTASTEGNMWCEWVPCNFGARPHEKSAIPRFYNTASLQLDCFAWRWVEFDWSRQRNQGSPEERILGTGGNWLETRPKCRKKRRNERKELVWWAPAMGIEIHLDSRSDREIKAPLQVWSVGASLARASQTWIWQSDANRVNVEKLHTSWKVSIDDAVFWGRCLFHSFSRQDETLEPSHWQSHLPVLSRAQGLKYWMEMDKVISPLMGGLPV